MENTVDFSGLSLQDLANDEAPASTPDAGASVVETTENETPASAADEVETEEDDTPWGSDTTSDDSDPNAGDEDTEEFAKLEASEKWRVKRLNKEIEAKKLAEAEAAALKAELEALKAGKKPAEKQEEAPQFTAQEFEQVLRENDPYIKALHERIELVKANKDKFDTMADYADALTELQSEYKSEIKDRKREYQDHQRAQASSAQQQETKIINDFYSATDALKETYPQIDKARAAIEANADKLHVDIRRALLLDEHKGELTWAIGSSRKNLQYLIEESALASRTGQTPIGALKLIGKMSDEVSKVKAPVTKAPAVPVVKTKPAGLPKTMRAKATGSHEEMDPYTWATKVARGEIKNTLF